MKSAKISGARDNKIDDPIVKVQFIEYEGKRKKKTASIEIKRSELDEIITQSENQIHVQFLLF